MTDLWLSLGSNLGDRAATLAAALKLLPNHGITVVAVSSLYATAPQGFQEQPEFLNCAARTQTDLPPAEALRVCRHVEDAFGRQRSQYWGPRTLDIDLLLYDDLRLDVPALTLPHPRMWERAFVLAPLVELWPDLRFPSEELASDRLAALLPGQPVRQVSGPEWAGKMGGS